MFLCIHIQESWLGCKAQSTLPLPLNKRAYMCVSLIVTFELYPRYYLTIEVPLVQPSLMQIQNLLIIWFYLQFSLDNKWI